MVFSFDLNRLNQLLKDFYILTKIRITVFNSDFMEVASYPEERASFCNLIRTDEKALKKCITCDREACKKVSKLHVPYIYQCHAGLTEAIAPIRLGNILIGYLFFGHVFPYESHEIGWKNIKDLCREYQLDMEKLKATCYDRPITSTDYVLAASHILESVAYYLCLERMVVMKNEALPIQIDTYITEHLSEDLSSQHLCEYFKISRTHLYHLSKENFGVGIADHIRNLRIKKAKKLLSDQPDISISEVASACGFDDYNYFISMFKRVVGMPPKQYMNSIPPSNWE